MGYALVFSMTVTINGLFPTATVIQSIFACFWMRELFEVYFGGAGVIRSTWNK